MPSSGRACYPAPSLNGSQVARQAHCKTSAQPRADGQRARAAAIPFIVHPIDNAVHLLLNVTMRPAMRKFICGAGQGALADLEICEACQLPQQP